MRCGRRWGKTKFCCILASEYAIGDKNASESRGHYVGYFAPEYKFLAEAYTAVLEFLTPVMKRSSRTEGKIITQSGGEVDFWTLDNDKAGLGRRYHLVVIDEAASTPARFLSHDSSVRISWISGKWLEDVPKQQVRWKIVPKIAVTDGMPPAGKDEARPRRSRIPKGGLQRRRKGKSAA